MKTIIITTLLALSFSTTQANASSIFDGNDPKLITKVSSWVNNNVKYPKSAIENKEEGIVYVAFQVVEGEIQTVEVVGGVSEILDAEALRILNSVPVSELGNAIAEDKSYILPIKFVLK